MEGPESLLQQHRIPFQSTIEVSTIIRPNTGARDVRHNFIALKHEVARGLSAMFYIVSKPRRCLARYKSAVAMKLSFSRWNIAIWVCSLCGLAACSAVTRLAEAYDRFPTFVDCKSCIIMSTVHRTIFLSLHRS